MSLGNTLELNKQGNVKLLHDPERLGTKMDLDKYTHVVKQRSIKCFQLHKEAKVTGSTLYRSIGLDTLKKQKEHYKELIQ